MRNKKPLSEHQKHRLGIALEVLNSPIFSTFKKYLHLFVGAFFCLG